MAYNSFVPSGPAAPMRPYSGGGGSFNYTDPTTPPPQQDGGGWVWDFAKGAWDFVKDNAGDILQTTGSLVEGYMSSQDRQKQLDELKRQFDAGFGQRQSEYDRSLAEQIAAREQSQGQFDRTTGNAEAQAAVRAQTQINAAPMADKAQALLLARMGVAPGAFQPRDITRGVSDLSRRPSAPGAPVSQAMQSAAANYRPGQGGVNMSAARMLLNRMQGTAPRPPQPAGPVAPPPPPDTRPTRPRSVPQLPTPYMSEDDERRLAYRGGAL